MWPEGEGNIERRVIASGGRTRRGRENSCTLGTSGQVRKLSAREPGDLGGACRERQAGGKRQTPHAPRVRRRGVGAGGSTEERCEPGRGTAGGESGGKRPRQGERGRGPARSVHRGGQPCPRGWIGCGQQHDVCLAAMHPRQEPYESTLTYGSVRGVPGDRDPYRDRFRSVSPGFPRPGFPPWCFVMALRPRPDSQSVPSWTSSSQTDSSSTPRGHSLDHAA